MFDLKYLLIIILLGIAIYLIYNLYSNQSYLFNKFKTDINEKIELELEDLNEKIDNIEELVENKLKDCNKKIKDLYSLQNKINEVNKMNSQSIINQFNQYDEGIDEAEGVDEKNQIFNSAENSINVVNNDKNNANCFVKYNQVKTNDKEMFFTSANNKSKESEISKKSKTSKTNEILNKKLDNNTDDDSDNSLVLEIDNNFINTKYLNNKSPKSNKAFDILNESSNIRKNSSCESTDEDKTVESKNSDNNMLNNFIRRGEDEEDEITSDENDSKQSDIIYLNDPPILHPEMLRFGSFNKIIEIQ
jgi:hypothetical protein